MSYDYLIVATNGMYEQIMASLDDPQPQDLARAATLGCNALRRLVKDDDFTDSLHTLAQRQRMLWPAEKEVTLALLDASASGNDIPGKATSLYGAYGRPAIHTKDHDAATPAFDGLMAFLRVEEEVLLMSGMRPEVIGELLEPIRKQGSAWRSAFIDPAVTEGSITKLRDVACTAAYSLETQRRTSNRLRRIMTGIGGAAILGVDGSAIVISFGMTAPMSAMSGAIGSALIGGAVAMPDE